MVEDMPVIFVGHGNPMNALQSNEITKAWANMGNKIPRPKAILSVSAHWYVPKLAVTAMSTPRTIHDFFGFPPDLYQVSYPAPGNTDLANHVQDLLSPIVVNFDNQWGLDHGTWSVLCHIYPKADIPVVQLSIDQTKPAAFHYEIGKKLVQLRKEGVLIIGSGNIVHNLYAYDWNRQLEKPFEWAIRFEEKVRGLLLATDDKSLINYEALGNDATLSIPTPDHYLPLLYIIACRNEGEKVTFPVEGIDGGSISMLTVQIG